MELQCIGVAEDYPQDIADADTLIRQFKYAQIK